MEILRGKNHLEQDIIVKLVRGEIIQPVVWLVGIGDNMNEEWKSILKRLQQIGQMVKIDGKYYRFAPNVINDYKQELQNMKNDPYLSKQNQETQIRIAKRRMVEKHNLKPSTRWGM